AVAAGQIVSVDRICRICVVQRGVSGGDLLRIGGQDRDLQRRSQREALVGVVIDTQLRRERIKAYHRQIVAVQRDVIEWPARGIVLGGERRRAGDQHGEQNADDEQTVHARNLPLLPTPLA